MPIKIRGLTLGEGRPKIIVPILAQSKEEAAVRASSLRHDDAADLIELRLDGLAETSADAMTDCLQEVRQILGDAKPLLVTIRTHAQGGLLPLDGAGYAMRVEALLAQGGADLLDLEFDPAAALPPALREKASAAGVYTVYSHHDFTATPPATAMTALLVAMGRAGADIAKLAVMPRTAADAAELLTATAAAKAVLPGLPLITMSMGPLGAVTRVCGGAFGSAATFGAVGAASAPGQPGASDLRTALDALQKCL